MDMIHFNWHPLLIQSYWSSFKWRDLCKPRNTTWWKLSFSSFSGRLGSLNSRGNDSLIKRQLWYGNVSFGRERYCLLECPARDQPGDSWSDVGRVSLLETVILGLKTSTIPQHTISGSTRGHSEWQWMAGELFTPTESLIYKEVSNIFLQWEECKTGRQKTGLGLWDRAFSPTEPALGWVSTGRGRGGD